MSKAKSGGGIQSNKVRNVGVKTGQPAKGINPQSAARIGMQVVTGTGIAKVGAPISGTLGNQTAKSAGQGPGAGRTVHPSGSQSKTPTAQPMTSSASWPHDKSKLQGQ